MSLLKQNRNHENNAMGEIGQAEHVEARRSALVFVYCVVLAVGLALRAPAIVIFASGCLLLVYLPRHYAESRPESLTYRTAFSESYAWPGDRLRLTVEVENRSFLPISLLQVTDEVPEGIEVEGSRLLMEKRTRFLQHAFNLGMWQRVRRHYPVNCKKRGEFVVGPSRLQLSGPLGYGQAERHYDPQARVIVYPRVHALSDLPTRPLALLGPSTLRSFLHEDPLRIRGVREYIPGDPPNRINWKATAKAARHMVHIHEPSAHISVMFLLNLANSDTVWQGLDDAETEWAIEVTASLGTALLDSHCSVGVVANDYITDLAIGAGEGHLQDFLVMLARANSHALWKPSPFVTSALDMRHFGTTLVLVTPVLTEEIMAAILQAEFRRSSLRVVYTGSAATSLFDDAYMLAVQRQG